MINEKHSLYQLKVGQRSLLLCVFSIFTASALTARLAEAAAVGQMCVELAALHRYTAGGQRQPNPQWMRSVCPVSFGSQRGLSSSAAPPAPAEPPTSGPLCVDPAPCGLAALWAFTCDCVQSPCSPPSEPPSLRPHLQPASDPDRQREAALKKWAVLS